ncbi:MAG: glycosyl hydrolase family 25 [Lachnospiraceae bacterium]|nr:glycosyl hydrolase family 25 [Lachnospiraceae bacterium]
MIKYGLDVSKHQNWGDLQKYGAGKDFVILRAGYGKNNIDDKFQQHKKIANTIDMMQHWGVYWFSYATTEAEARKEADYCWMACLSTERGDVFKPDYPFYFDLEYDSQKYFKKQTGRDMTKDDVIKFTKAFCDRIEELGGFAGYYCNKDFYKRYYSGLTQYSCWLADYSNSSFEGRPSHIHMIQTGSTPVDYDVCRVDFPSIIKNKGLNGYKQGTNIEPPKCDCGCEHCCK